MAGAAPSAVNYVANALLPGAALVARGQLAVGLGLLVAALLALCLVALGFAGVPGFDTACIARDALAYAALALAADLGLWALARQPRIDAVAVRGVHREAATAYLRNDLPAAVAAATRLTRIAPGEPGAWDLLALMAKADGKAAIAAKAARHARAIERQP